MLCDLGLLVTLQNAKNNSPGVGVFFSVSLQAVIFPENLDNISHLKPRFHLWKNQAFDFQWQYPWKTPVEECHCNERY